MAGLTSIQNEFLKMRLQNNPEFAAKYFPNVIMQPPSGPLYDVTPDYKRSIMFSSPKTVYETGAAAGPFSYMDDPSSAEFRKVNVPYDTPGSLIDIEPKESYAPEHAYAYITPSHMEQRTKHGQYIPITSGQASTIYMKPEMIKTYGAPVTSPRGEMVPTPEYWPDQSVDYVNQAEINNFIEDVSSHEVSHAVSAMPEYTGLPGIQPQHKIVTQIDFNKLFPAAGSAEAQKAIGRLGMLKQSGGALGPVTEEFPWGEYLGGPDYPQTWIEDLISFDQEELYNRAKDLEKIRKKHPKDYWKQVAWRNNINFINMRLSRFPEQFPSETYGPKPKVGTYLKKIDPQVKKYMKKVEDKIKKEKGVVERFPPSTWTPAGGDGGGRDFQPQRPTRSGGFTDPGKGSYGPWKSKGGIIDKALPGRSRDI